MEHSSQDGFVEGQKIGAQRYALIRQLGKGGMGVVWLAHDVSLNEELALKFLPPEIQHDPDALDDMRRETQKSRKLTHPNIIRIHDFVHFQGETPFISMEFVDGSPLNQLKARQPNRLFAWSYVAPLVQQMCEALEYAHSEGVIHRDLKPGNMMVDKKGRLKLADFGIAAQVNETMGRVSVKHTSSGTPTYMSPQQMNGQMPKVTDDIYALGATIYELLTSKPPFFSGNILHQVENVEATPMDQRLQEFGLSNDIPPTVGALVTACLDKDPAKRPQCMGAVMEWFGFGGHSRLASRTFKQGQPSALVESVTASPAMQEPVTGAAETPARSNTGLWIGISVAALMVLGLSGWFLFGKRPADRASMEPSPGGSVVAKTSPGGGSPPANLAYPQPRAWIDATEEVRSAGLKDGSLVVNGEWLEATKSSWHNLGRGKNFGDVAVKVIFSNKAHVELRRTKVGYRGGFAGTSGRISMVNEAGASTGLNNQVDIDTKLSDSAHELVFAAQGDKLSLWLDGKVVANATDGTLTAGKIELMLFADGQSKPPRVKKVEYGELDPPSYPQPRAWIDATEEVRSRGLRDGSLAMDGEWLEAKKTFWPTVGQGKSFGNVAVRVVFFNQVGIRLRHSDSKSYGGTVAAHIRRNRIMLEDDAGARTDLDNQVDLATNLENAAHELVFAAQGDELSLWLDGKQVAHAKDRTLTSGDIQLPLFTGAKPARVKKVEYGELPAASAAASAENWQDWMAVQRRSGNATSGFKADGDAWLSTGANRDIPLWAMRDGAIRTSFTFPKDRDTVSYSFRGAIKTTCYEPFVARSGTQAIVGLHRFDQGAFTKLAQWPTKIDATQEMTFEARVVGDTFTFRLQGQLIATFQDSSLRDSGLAAIHASTTGTRISHIEVLNLDPPAVSSSPATATKNAPNPPKALQKK